MVLHKPTIKLIFNQIDSTSCFSYYHINFNDANNCYVFIITLLELVCFEYVEKLVNIIGKQCEVHYCTMQTKGYFNFPSISFFKSLILKYVVVDYLIYIMQLYANKHFNHFQSNAMFKTVYVQLLF